MNFGRTKQKAEIRRIWREYRFKNGIYLGDPNHWPILVHNIEFYLDDGTVYGAGVPVEGSDGPIS